MALEDRAEKTRIDLFQRYDQLNALWQKAEEQLRKNHIPRAVHYDIPIADPNPDDNEWHESLSLQKIQGEWRICHGGCWDYAPEDLEWRPIVECSVEIRVEAVRHLPGLRQAAVESAETFIPEVESAIQQLSELTA